MRWRYASLSTSFGIVSLIAMLSCPCNSASTENDKKSQSDSVCGAREIVLFSCESESQKLISLCLSKDDLTFEVLVIEKFGHLTKILPATLNQVVGGGNSGPSTIVKAATASEDVYFYADRNTAEPSPNVVTFGFNGTETREFCLPSSTKTPLTKWFGPHNDWPAGVDLFDLEVLKISSPFDFNDDQFHKLWRSWPNKSHQ